MTDDPVDLSVQYLSAVRRGDPAGPREELASLDPDDLEARLDSDPERLTFWLNVYNAAVQDLLADDPSLFERKRSFFGRPLLTVAGYDCSLDRVEHGVLRRSRPKLGLGYVPNPFPGEFERRFRVTERDPRIHFALNCGAASCPPIAGYSAADIDAELDEMTAAYLSNAVAYDPDAGVLFDGVVRVPRLFLWFRGDFGGRSGILRFLRRYDLILSDAAPRITHDEYDWSLRLGQYVDDHEVTP